MADNDISAKIVIRGGRPILKVGNASEKEQFKELLERNRLKIEVDEGGENEKCPFEPEKEYKESFCGFLDEWLKEKVPGTNRSRADALAAVKMAKGEVPESEEEREKPKKEVR